MSNLGPLAVWQLLVWHRRKAAIQLPTPLRTFLCARKKAIEIGGTMLRQPAGRIESEHFMRSVKSTVANTFRLSGRSRRSEFIFYWVAVAAVGMIPFVLHEAISYGGDIGRSVFVLSAILLIPFPALLVRRLHDQNRSGWGAFAWAPAVLTGIVKSGEPIGLALGILVGLGNLLVLAFLLWPGSTGYNRFGPSPRANVNSSFPPKACRASRMRRNLEAVDQYC